MLVGGPVVLSYIGTPVIHEVGLEVDVAKDAPELLHERLEVRVTFVRPPIVVLPVVEDCLVAVLPVECGQRTLPNDAARELINVVHEVK